MRAVSLTDEAVDDLEAVREWQTQGGSGASARKRVKAILLAIRRLRRTPCLHALGEQPGTREFTSNGHRVLYTVQPDTGSNMTAGNVSVLRVYGPGQAR